MNSKDLCLIDYLPELCRGGFTALKIEGRNKSSYYVANTVRIYREAMDAYFAEGAAYHCQNRWHEELSKISHREYTAGFAEGQAAESSMRYSYGGYIRNYDFTAIIRGKREDMLLLEQRNHIGIGDELEIIFPNGSNTFFQVGKIYDEGGLSLSVANHPRQLIAIPYGSDLEINQPLIVRRPVK